MTSNLKALTRRLKRETEKMKETRQKMERLEKRIQRIQMTSKKGKSKSFENQKTSRCQKTLKSEKSRSSENKKTSKTSKIENLKTSRTQSESENQKTSRCQMTLKIGKLNDSEKQKTSETSKMEKLKTSRTHSESENQKTSRIAKHPPTPSEVAATSSEEKEPRRRRRHAFTTTDDVAMWTFLIAETRRERAGRRLKALPLAPSGVATWRDFRNEIGSKHSAVSLCTRFRRFILPNIDDKCPLESADRDEIRHHFGWKTMTKFDGNETKNEDLRLIRHLIDRMNAEKSSDAFRSATTATSEDVWREYIRKFPDSRRKTTADELAAHVSRRILPRIHEYFDRFPSPRVFLHIFAHFSVPISEETRQKLGAKLKCEILTDTRGIVRAVWEQTSLSQILAKFHENDDVVENVSAPAKTLEEAINAIFSP